LILVIVAGLAVAGGLLWWSQQKNAGKQAQGQGRGQVPAVVVKKATEELVDEPRLFTGRVEPIQRVALTARVRGFLQSIEFEEGAMVEKGQLLYVIEPDEFEANLQSAQAQLSRSEARLREAEKNYNRSRELRSEDAIPEQQLDDAQARFETAQADVDAARAAVRQAELNLEWTRIESPLDGRIGATRFDVGEVVGPQSGPLASIVQLDPIRVEFSIAESRYAEIVREHGLSGRAQDWARSLQFALKVTEDFIYDHPGTLDFISNQIEPQTATLPVRLRFPNPEQILLPGQFVRVEVQAADPEKRVALPPVAVMRDAKGSYVLTVNDQDQAQRVPVEVHSREQARVYLEPGLEPGTPVIVQGVQKARPGEKVRVSGSESGQNPSAGASRAGRSQPGSAKPEQSPARDNATEEEPS
jgi:membrane fusion protein (multidrug efflux system)